MLRERVFLVCYVIRVGGMDVKEYDYRRSSIQPNNPKKGQTEGVRRPFGVAAMDITNYFSGKLETDDEEQKCAPFIQLVFILSYFTHF